MMTGRQLVAKMKEGSISSSEFLEIVSEEFAAQNGIIAMAKALNIKDANDIELEFLKNEFSKV